ncbi:smg-9, nonsense mediated mRNA decay factor [Lobulomyces angularis]|nr:smg-9, nonsense mediated mRNA decay factor [Lobulomyces angularis]
MSDNNYSTRKKDRLRRQKEPNSKSKQPEFNPKVLLKQPVVQDFKPKEHKLSLGVDPIDIINNATKHLYFTSQRIKIFDDSLQLLSDRPSKLLSEKPGCFIIGMLGRSSVGKTTLTHYFTKMGNHDEINEINQNQKVASKDLSTIGIDLWITPEGVIILDTHPIFSKTVYNRFKTEVTPSTSQEQALFDNPDKWVEHNSIQLALFLISVCHVVIAVSDKPEDIEFWEFLKRVENLKKKGKEVEVKRPRKEFVRSRDGGYQELSREGKDDSRSRDGGYLELSRDGKKDISRSKDGKLDSRSRDGSKYDRDGNLLDEEKIFHSRKNSELGKENNSLSETKQAPPQEDFFPELIFIGNKIQNINFSTLKFQQHSEKFREFFKDSKFRTKGSIGLQQAFPKLYTTKNQNSNIYFLPLIKSKSANLIGTKATGSPPKSDAVVSETVNNNFNSIETILQNFSNFSLQEKNFKGQNDLIKNNNKSKNEEKKLKAHLDAFQMEDFFSTQKIETIFEEFEFLPERPPILIKILINQILEIPRFFDPTTPSQIFNSQQQIKKESTNLNNPSNFQVLKYYQMIEKEWFKTTCLIAEKMKKQNTLFGITIEKNSNSTSTTNMNNYYRDERGDFISGNTSREKDHHNRDNYRTNHDRSGSSGYRGGDKRSGKRDDSYKEKQRDRK